MVVTTVCAELDSGYTLTRDDAPPLNVKIVTNVLKALREVGMLPDVKVKLSVREARRLKSVNITELCGILTYIEELIT